MKGVGTLVERQQSLLRKEWQETADFIAELKSKGKLRKLNPAFLSGGKNTSDKPSIDRELENYWHPPIRY